MFKTTRYYSAAFDGPLASPDSGGNAVGSSPAPAPLPVRVLLVDDHEDTNRSLVLLLGRRGYKVKAATSLHEATELAAHEEFDVLVSDMSLPDGNGLELLGLLRDKLPVYGGIVLSGYNDDEDLERSRAAGFKAHLSKPVEVSELDETIRRIILAATGAA